MLYFPWFDESTDLLGRYSTCEEHHNHVKHIVIGNELKYTQAMLLLRKYMNLPEHVWNLIAPNTESN